MRLQLVNDVGEIVRTWDPAPDSAPAVRHFAIELARAIAGQRSAQQPDSANVLGLCIVCGRYSRTPRQCPYCSAPAPEDAPAPKDVAFSEPQKEMTDDESAPTARVSRRGHRNKDDEVRE